MEDVRDLPFSIEEYRARVAKLQRIMTERGLDACLCHNLANVCYFTGVETLSCDGFVCIVPREGRPTLFGSDFEMHNALVSSWTTDNVTYPVMADPQAALVDLLIARGWADKRLGTDSLSYPLIQALPKASFVEAREVVDSVKVIKSPAEIAYIRQACELTDAGMKAAIQTAAEGRTDNDVAAAAYEVMVRGGSEYMCIQPIITVGRRSGIPHTTFHRTHIEHGDTVFMEMAACVRRYSGPIMRTVIIGKAAKPVRHMADACLASLNALLGNIKPGAVSCEVAAKAKQAWQSQIQGLVWHGYYGYSIGLGFPPTWSDCDINIREGEDTVLQPGMVFHCTTSLRDVGNYGTAFSETVLITEDGHEVLTNLPRELLIK